MISNFFTRFFRWKQTEQVKRFEFLLPLKYNDGTEIEPEKFNQTARELTERFSGLAQDLVQVHGMWQYQGTDYQDILIRFRIDSRDLTATAFLKTYKEKLKERFQQLDIWITAHEIEVI